MIRFIRLSRNGFALSIVLWIVAALLFAIAFLALLSKDTLYLTKGIDAKLKTQLMAEDVLEVLKFYVLTADYDNVSFKSSNFEEFTYTFPSQIIADNRWYSLDNNISIRVQDTSSMLNVMKQNPNTIANLATTSSQRQLRYVIEDSLTDWTDKDNVVSLNGAESSRYELKANVKYKIRNSKAIQSSEELRLINGISDMKVEEWQALKERLYYGNGTVVNLCLIDEKYLAYLLNINESEASALIQSREDDMPKFIKLASASKSFTDDFMSFSLSKQLNIEVKVSLGDATSILQTLIDFRPNKDNVYTTIKYKIN